MAFPSGISKRPYEGSTRQSSQSLREILREARPVKGGLLISSSNIRSPYLHRALTWQLHCIQRPSDDRMDKRD